MKKIFKKWLKKQVVNNIPFGRDYESAFEWIYNSPITQWRKKLWCLKMRDYEMLYEWLNS